MGNWSGAASLWWTPKMAPFTPWDMMTTKTESVVARQGSWENLSTALSISCAEHESINETLIAGPQITWYLMCVRPNIPVHWGLCVAPPCILVPSAVCSYPPRLSQHHPDFPNGQSAHWWSAEPHVSWWLGPWRRISDHIIQYNKGNRCMTYYWYSMHYLIWSFDTLIVHIKLYEPIPIRTTHQTTVTHVYGWLKHMHEVNVRDITAFKGQRKD